LHVHQQPHQPYFRAKIRRIPGLCARRHGCEQSERDSHVFCAGAAALTTDSSHSPSTHTSPSTTPRFSQRATSRVKQLLAQTAATKAGLRCGAVTPTDTLVSP